MHDLTHTIALVLLVAGVALCLVGTIGVLVVPDTMTRLHYVTPVTSIGIPLAALAIVVDTGLSRAAVKVLLIAGVVALAGPAVTTATARVVAQNHDLVPPEEPS